MKDKMTPEEWLVKVGWAGGIDEGFEYGLKHTDLNNSDSKLNDLVKNASEAFELYRKQKNKLNKYAENKYQFEDNL